MLVVVSPCTTTKPSTTAAASITPTPTSSTSSTAAASITPTTTSSTTSPVVVHAAAIVLVRMMLLRMVLLLLLIVGSTAATTVRRIRHVRSGMIVGHSVGPAHHGTRWHATTTRLLLLLLLLHGIHLALLLHGRCHVRRIHILLRMVWSRVVHAHAGGLTTSSSSVGIITVHVHLLLLLLQMLLMRRWWRRWWRLLRRCWCCQRRSLRRSVSSFLRLRYGIVRDGSRRVRSTGSHRRCGRRDRRRRRRWWWLSGHVLLLRLLLLLRWHVLDLLRSRILRIPHAGIRSRMIHHVLHHACDNQNREKEKMRNPWNASNNEINQFPTTIDTTTHLAACLAPFGG